MRFSEAMLTVVVAVLSAAHSLAFIVPGCTLHSSMLSTHWARSDTRRPATRPAMSLASPPPSFAPSPPDATEVEIKSIRSHDEFLAAMAENQEKLVVIEFYDQFCRACDEVRPRYEELARKNSEFATFYDLEFSVRKDLCKQLGIRRLPTVQIYSGGDGRVADLPAGPSRFSQVEKALADIVEKEARPEKSS